jgi:hypothetical protein
LQVLTVGWKPQKILNRHFQGISFEKFVGCGASYLPYWRRFKLHCLQFSINPLLVAKLAGISSKSKIVALICKMNRQVRDSFVLKGGLYPVTRPHKKHFTRFFDCVPTPKNRLPLTKPNVTAQFRSKLRTFVCLLDKDQFKFQIN